MFNVLEARLQQKKRTIAYPKSKPALPDSFRGRPKIQRSLCPADCRVCVDVCPTDAICCGAKGMTLDMGRCLFCGECARYVRTRRFVTHSNIASPRETGRS